MKFDLKSRSSFYFLPRSIKTHQGLACGTIAFCCAGVISYVIFLSFFFTCRYLICGLGFLTSLLSSELWSAPYLTILPSLVHDLVYLRLVC